MGCKHRRLTWYMFLCRDAEVDVNTTTAPDYIYLFAKVYLHSAYFNIGIVFIFQVILAASFTLIIFDDKKKEFCNCGERDVIVYRRVICQLRRNQSHYR